MSVMGQSHRKALGRFLALGGLLLGLQGCGDPPNNPYAKADSQTKTLYTSFEERPKHLDPARAYSANEY